MNPFSYDRGLYVRVRCMHLYINACVFAVFVTARPHRSRGKKTFFTDIVHLINDD